MKKTKKPTSLRYLRTAFLTPYITAALASTACGKARPYNMDRAQPIRFGWEKEDQKGPRGTESGNAKGDGDWVRIDVKAAEAKEKKGSRSTESGNAKGDEDWVPIDAKEAEEKEKQRSEHAQGYEDWVRIDWDT